MKKIKTRFQLQPTVYKSFLDILHAYHKEQHTIKDVYDQVCISFAQLSSLLLEFLLFSTNLCNRLPPSLRATRTCSRSSRSFFRIQLRVQMPPSLLPPLPQPKPCPLAAIQVEKLAAQEGMHNVTPPPLFLLFFTCILIFCILGSYLKRLLPLLHHPQKKKSHKERDLLSDGTPHLSPPSSSRPSLSSLFLLTNFF